MASIFEIQNDMLRAFQAIEDNDGDITPEIEMALNIGKDNLKNKIKSYVAVVKLLQNDISLIKEETDRLKSLKTNKERTIDWLKSTMIKAIEQFGDIDKKGQKFIDYGLGKVSITNREVAQVDEEDVEDFTTNLIHHLTWLNMNNQLDSSIVTTNDLLESINESRENKLNLDELKYIDADIQINISLSDLIDTSKGFNLAKALIKFNQFKIKSKVDKTEIKGLYKDDMCIPKFSQIVESKSINIK